MAIDNTLLEEQPNKKQKVETNSDSDPDGLFDDDDDDDDDDEGEEGSDPDGLFDDEEPDDEEDEFEMYFPKISSPTKSKSMLSSKFIASVDNECTPIIHYSADWCFLRWYFGSSQVLIMEAKLTDGVNIDFTIHQNQKSYQLVAVKCVDKANDIFRFKTKWLKAYYVQHQSPQTLKAELEQLANFEKLPPKKTVSRLELLVSPAKSIKSGPAQFVLPSTKFELIDENQNEGCGFIPQTILDELGLTSFSYIQVRLIGPDLGVFKGMLEVKPGIKKIQLPPSMHKVGKSTKKTKKTCKLYRSMYLIVIGLFPSVSSFAMSKAINPNSLRAPTKSDIKDLKGPQVMIQRILQDSGVSPDIIEDYVRKCATSFDEHSHHNMVGVADPTGGQIPKGCIFVAGFGVLDGSSPPDRVQDVFVSRTPATEPKDGQVLPRLESKPAGMSVSNWNFLRDLPFGAIVFGRSEENQIPIPNLIANGDLDGDSYFVMWDREVLSHINVPSSEVEVPDEVVDDPNIGRWFHEWEGSKSTQWKVERQLSKSAYEASSLDGHKKIYKEISKEDLNNKHDLVVAVMGHEGKGAYTRVKLRFESGSEKSYYLTEKRDEIPNLLHNYASENQLLGENGWKGIDALLEDDNTIVEVLAHKHTSNLVELKVLYEHGESQWLKSIDLEPEELEMDDPLLIYCENLDLLKLREFAWIRKNESRAKKMWFKNTQELLADANRHRAYDRLTKKLHLLFEKSHKENGPSDQDTIALGRAYKLSNDLFKHGGKVAVPLHFVKKIPKNLHAYISY